jgi:hypothetical protein
MYKESLNLPGKMSDYDFRPRRPKPAIAVANISFRQV